MGRGLELVGKGGLVLAFAAGCTSGEGESSPGSSESTSKAAAVIVGTVVHTEDKRGIPVGVIGYLAPDDPSKQENGWYPEGAKVPLTCFVIGRLGVDANVPGPNPVQWSVWYGVDGGHNGEPQWLPEPYVWPAAPLQRC